MISLSKLLGEGMNNYGDSLRYSVSSNKVVNGTGYGKGPVVIWNCTGSCNLKCQHCYYNSEEKDYSGELTTEEAKRFIDDLANFNVPVILFSGGEPLMRKDLFQLIDYAAQKDIRATISTNGTLLDEDAVKQLQSLGIGYVGISLDGIGERHDCFRGQKGAFEKTLRGIRQCLSSGLRVGLRFTITRKNYHDIPEIFRLVEEEGIPRLCFYHLVYSGRGSEIKNEDINPEETRNLMDLIMEKTLYFEQKGQPKEILMVDNHADGVYIYLQMKKRNEEKAGYIYRLLKNNGGNRSGIAVSAVDNKGNVHPDQFTLNHSFGNVKSKSFGEIWSDTSHPILRGLKNRKPLLKGRCTSCRWLEICNGNFRSRAEAVYGDFWAPDPACYLTDEEIS